MISLSVSQDQVRVKQRLRFRGQPAALLTNRSGSRLFAALDTTGQIAVVDTRRDRLVEKFNAVAPSSVYDDRRLLGGANTNALALLPDERTLLASNGGQNSVAVVRLSDQARDVAAEAAHGDRRQPRAGDNDHDENEAQGLSNDRGPGAYGLVSHGSGYRRRRQNLVHR